KEYDTWLSSNPQALQQKLDRLTEVLLKMNGGRGPDILALVEGESLRAAQLLQQALNAKLSDPSLHYKEPLMKEVAVGRHIAPTIITRLPVVRDRTRSYDKSMRIVEGRITVEGKELVVIASHWTSRLTDKTGKSRAKYADKIYGAV